MTAPPAFVDPTEHRAFLEVLGSMHASDARWTPTMAGFVTLRLVDKWSDALRGWLAPRPSEVAAVRDSITKVRPGPTANVLGAITDILTRSWGRRHPQVAARLLAYAGLLYGQNEWALSRDVYRTFLRFASTKSETDLVQYAWHRLGMCGIWLGDFDDAESAQETARDLAHAAGDHYTALSAEQAIALIISRRGNLPRAATHFDAVIAACEAHLSTLPALTSVLTRALQDAGGVALRRGQIDDAFGLLGRAFRGAPTARERERILNDLAVAFQEIGLLDMARRSLLIVEATAEDRTIRWVASLNLMHLATLTGSDIAFETHRRRVAKVALPPRLAVDYAIYLGEEYRRVGLEREARTSFDRAIALAERHHLNEPLIQAEAARNAVPEPVVPAAPGRPELGDAIVRVVGMIEQLSAELVGAGA